MNKEQKDKSDELKRILEKLSDSALDSFKKDIEETQKARNSSKEKEKKEEDEEEEEDDFCNCVDKAITFADIAYDLIKAMDTIIDNSAELYAMLLDEELDDITIEKENNNKTIVTAKFVSGRSYTYKIKMPQPLENAEIAAYKLANL